MQEFPWRDDAGADRFLDLVVRKRDIIVTIECKKTQKEIFTFLQPSGTSDQSTLLSRCLFIKPILDSSNRFDRFCGPWNLNPRSSEAAFCVVQTSREGDRRLLEKDAQLLVRGTDAYGRLLRFERKATVDDRVRVIVPVIVTNAKLLNANYNPNDVSLETGQLPRLPQPDISPVEVVRFRKAFTAANHDLDGRTVFVVAATSLQNFLHDLKDMSGSPSHLQSIIVPE
jgi:hypothetical protein